jgi:hypothetical protein
MEAIILNNRIQLVSSESNYIEISLLVPARNLQKFKELTNCSILSKIETKVNHNHYAGVLFTVKIRVEFLAIKKYLQRESIYDCENKNEYTNLLNQPSIFYLTYFECNLLADKVALYAFGDCRKFTQSNNNTIYRNKAGHKISLVNSIQNDFGQKRYINFKGQWYSNKTN